MRRILLLALVLGPGWAVKRTSTRARNPRNAPDSLESLALRYFVDAAVDGGELPSAFVPVTPAGQYRCYMPLQMGPMCLPCHKPRDSLDPIVRGVLEERYPSDRATGYAAGDFRGVVRVSMPRQAVR